MTDSPDTTAASGSISVVIPNVNGAAWLEECLPSIAGGAVTPHEVIVADDGSDDGSRDVCARFGATFLDHAGSSTGFAATANRGIRAATGDWVFLLNNDTQVTSSTIEQLVRGCERHPDAGIIAPLVLSLRDRVTVDSAGMLLFPDGTARPRWHGRRIGELTPREEEVLLPSGAAMLLRMSRLREVGLLDEGMTSYLEDVDLALRIRRRGGRTIFVPAALVYHHFSGTTGALSPAKARLIERNHVTIAVRHLPRGTVLLLPLWTALRWLVMTGTVLRARGMATGSGEPASTVAKAAVRGAAEGIRRIPRAAGERRALSQSAVVPEPEWRALLRAHRAHLGDYLRFGSSETPLPDA